MTSSARRATLIVLATAAAAIAPAAPAAADTSNTSSTAVGTGVTLAPLPAADTDIRAATLADGRVLAIDDEDPVLFTPSTGVWGDAAPGSGLEAAAVAPLAGDRALVVFDAASNGADSLAEIYNGSNNSWTTTNPMPAGRLRAAATVLPSGQVLVAGGYPTDYSSDLTSTEIYNPSTGGWQSGPQLPDGFQLITMVTTGGKVIAFGYGQVDGNRGGTTTTYDPTSGSWTTPLPLPQSAAATGAVALADGDVAIVGSAQPVEEGSTFDGEIIYDPATGGLVSGAPLPSDQPAGAVTLLLDGRVLMAGGYEEQPVTQNGNTYYENVASAQAATWTPSGAITPAEELAPTLTSSTGTPAIGSYLVGTSGDFNDDPRTLQLQRCSALGCIDDGAPTVEPNHYQGLNYTAQSQDVGQQLQLAVTVNGITVDSPRTPTVQLNGEVGDNPNPDNSYDIYNPNIGPLQLGTAAAQLTVQRAATGLPSTIKYEIDLPTANVDQAFPAIDGTISFAAGQGSAALTIPATDAGQAIPSGTLNVSLGLASDGNIATEKPLAVSVIAAANASGRDIGNPLGLASATAADPLAGASFYVDRSSIAARVAYLWRNTHPTNSGLLRGIAGQPDVRRFGAWNGTHPGHAVGVFLNQAGRKEPGTIPMISTYRIIHGQCHTAEQTQADYDAYDAWIKSFAQGIGSHKAVLFLEMDSIITTPCLDRNGLIIRLAELRDAVTQLAADPHLVVYLDAGAADALNPARAAALLKAADVAGTQGFFLNSTHFDWTKKEIAYGEKISKLTGGKHFVINTAENGQGPLIPKDRAVNGNEVLCNPPGRGLGPLPTASTGYPNVDAFAWIANPGVSGGPCVPGAPKTGVFWPAEAVSLAQHADFKVR